ncbi:MAG TPA: polysaccharide deacetylase family protein [Bacteroidales bacterium]|jgi:peptidoglycan/xylan/chitin deacetylase (PgdA/CDA1 family)|nr:polysaccharide deacetylase family protein [Bacteroidales bacterium]
MIYWNTPRFIIKWFSHLEWHYSRKEKTIYLTFDDGPTPGITQQVLDLLDKYNAKATFFCLGRNVDRHRDIFHEIIARGHSTGNHTYSHLKGWKSSVKAYAHDVNLASKYIPSKLFRPPYGRIRHVQTRYLSKEFRIIMWDVLSHDYNRKISQKICLKSVLKSTKNGSVVVFHDSEKASKNMLFVLPRLLEHFSKKGFTFSRIE